jgi:hypothetical protein
VLKRPPIDLPTGAQVLDRLGLDAEAEQPFPNDGWSGAELTLIARGPDRFVVKRDSVARDWIARATRDGPLLREAWFAAAGLPLPAPWSAPYLGVGRDGDEFLLVMPDLGSTLITWEQPLDEGLLVRVLEAIGRLHAARWPDHVLDTAHGAWCPLRERLLLLSRPSGQRYLGWGGRAAVAGERFVAGWDAFERLAPRDARDLVRDLSSDVAPLVAALDQEPATVLHGDLKLANLGIAADGSLPAVDWQMVMVGPVALELGWFLVSNSASLPWLPTQVLDRYRQHAALDDASADLTWIVGLLMRGWRKGLDAEAGETLASGVAAADDLAWWCSTAVEAAGRRLWTATPERPGRAAGTRSAPTGSRPR